MNPKRIASENHNRKHRCHNRHRENDENSQFFEKLKSRGPRPIGVAMFFRNMFDQRHIAIRAALDAGHVLGLVLRTEHNYGVAMGL